MDGAKSKELATTLSPGQDPLLTEKADNAARDCLQTVSTTPLDKDSPSVARADEIVDQEQSIKTSLPSQSNQRATPVMEPETKYVLSGQPTGWAAMSNEVREFDQERVQSAKEDVDTLLVFAGLFSAILSAFLVSAYPSLQSSPADIIAYTLDRIALQTSSYNFTDGKLVSTTIAPPPESFVPQMSGVAILVNILWFASLILSLMTASFGMLVKQWLREFLAVENPSPQARLRIRHFHEPQLKKWLVYEIVACLPLLLQLSLGLFFAGLCYFTASMNSSIGNTALPLVVGWALCIFAATILPIFFPRCPYRTTLLKTIVADLHHLLSHIAEQIRLKGVPSNDSHKDLHPTFWQHVVTLSTRITRLVSGRINLTILLALRVISLQREIWPAIASRLLSTEWWYTCYATLHDASIKMLRGLRDADERLVVEDSASDVNVLVTVDAIEGYDEFLGTTIAEALRYVRPQRDEVGSFLIQVISHRITTTDELIPGWPFDHCRPLEYLRPQASEVLIYILHDQDFIGKVHSHHQLVCQDQGPTLLDRMWLRNILLLVSMLRVARSANHSNTKVSNTQQIVSQPLAIQCVQQGLLWMYGDSGRHLQSAAHIPPDNWRYVALRLRILADMRDLLELDAVKAAEYFALIWTEVLTAIEGHTRPFSWDFPDMLTGFHHQEQVWTAGVPQTIVEYLCALLSSILVSFKSGQVREGDPRILLFKEIFSFTICFCASPLLAKQQPRNQDRAKLVTALIRTMALSMKHEWSTDILLDICKPLNDTRVDLQLLTDWALLYQEESMPNARFTEEDLAIFSSHITNLLSASHTNLLDLLILCRTVIFLFLILNARTAGVANCREVFARIASTIQDHCSLDHDAPHVDQELKRKTQQTTDECLANMEFESDWKSISSIFPDVLIEVLSKLTDPDTHRHNVRFQALLERRYVTQNTDETTHQEPGPSFLPMRAIARVRSM